MAGSFSATVSAWAQKSEQRMTAVARESAQTLASEIRKPVGEGGRMPVITGNLRRSLLASTTAMPTIQRDQREFPDNEEQITLEIAGWEMGTPLYLGFQAAYSRVREYDYGFVAMSAQRWQQIVDESARIIQSRVG
ncbi:hypothetical protein [Pelagibacterium lentulum]|uniref:HK97 gp10 family phage protein n=1 Tax=Pelagibacterium lentulum TaxID=2029865 RepID=A0A916W4D2_9HYPH|nr:hypothetical protein [Pelagibacterium lentulum]GGA64939.1 hypothetical protein GCM10011499_39240 [Pelagibacterium lentulum]